jgi:hypothetical protein
MKKVVITGFFIGTFLITNAQNGGQANENGTSKIEYLGDSQAGQAIIRVTNKQSCAAVMKLTYQNLQRTKTVQALGSDTFQITRETGGCDDACEVKAKPLTNCGGANMGQVETSICQTVPIKFEYIKVRKVSSREFEIEFKASETDGEDRFNIQLSEDGLSFKTVAVVLPSRIIENQIYKIKISL